MLHLSSCHEQVSIDKHCQTRISVLVKCLRRNRPGGFNGSPAPTGYLGGDRGYPQNTFCPPGTAGGHFGAAFERVGGMIYGGGGTQVGRATTQASEAQDDHAEAEAYGGDWPAA